MLEIKTFLSPLQGEALACFDDPVPGSWATYVDAFTEAEHFPSLQEKKIAIIGVPDDRGALYPQNAEKSPDRIRSYFYALFPSSPYGKVVDLGNIIPGNTPTDTYFALRQIVKYLFEFDILPLIIGGSQELTFAIYKAFDEMKRLVNLTTLDSRLDMGAAGDEPDETSYLSKIVTQKPNYLFNFSNLGYQSYLNDAMIIKLMNDFYFDVHRLGDIRANLMEAEALLRNTDILSFDISSVRQGDAPGQNFPSPNGFYADEVCQLMYFAGLSEKVVVAGLFNYHPGLDVAGQSAHLMAQLMWHFIAGYMDRFYESPWVDDTHFMLYNVQFENDLLVFYRSKTSERWWMEVPVPEPLQERYGKKFLVPCSPKDYQTAGQGEFPDLYIKTMQKMH